MAEVLLAAPGRPPASVTCPIAFPLTGRARQQGRVAVKCSFGGGGRPNVDLGDEGGGRYRPGKVHMTRARPVTRCRG